MSISMSTSKYDESPDVATLVSSYTTNMPTRPKPSYRFTLDPTMYSTMYLSNNITSAIIEETEIPINAFTTAPTKLAEVLGNHETELLDTREISKTAVVTALVTVTIAFLIIIIVCILRKICVSKKASDKMNNTITSFGSPASFRKNSQFNETSSEGSALSRKMT